MTPTQETALGKLMARLRIEAAQAVSAPRHDEFTRGFLRGKALALTQAAIWLREAMEECGLDTHGRQLEEV